MSDATQQRGFYRSRSGVFLGVCKGIAESNGVSVALVRFVAIVLFFVAGFWPAILLYLIGAVLMKPEPVLQPESPSDQEFYNSYTTDRAMALGRLKRKYDEVLRRTERLEHIVTAKGYDWDRRMGQS